MWAILGTPGQDHAETRMHLSLIKQSFLDIHEFMLLLFMPLVDPLADFCIWANVHKLLLAADARAGYCAGASQGWIKTCTQSFAEIA